MTTSFLNSIIEVMSILPGFTTTQGESGELNLYKDDFMFGVITNDELKLIEKNGKFSAKPEQTMNNRDDLLLAATKAYWIASGKI